MTASRRMITSLIATLICLLLMAAATPARAAATVDRGEDVRVWAMGQDVLRAQQWNLDRIRLPEGLVYAPSAAGQVLAVLDTGVDGLHTDLAGVVLPGHDVVGVSDGRVDPNGHGTHVAGIAAAVAGNDIGIAGTAPGLKILPVRVLDEIGSGTAADVAEGINWAVANGATIINLSLGGTERAPIMEDAIRAAVAKGIVVIAAAGNLSSSDPVWPAAMPEVIGVTATDDEDRLPSFASSGIWVDLAAPGDGIVSLFTANGYAAMSGTSMATPLVAGIAALVLAREPDLTPARIQARLRYGTEDIGASGRDALFGFGLLDAARTLTPAPTFTDVSGTHRTAVREMAITGITSGCAADRYCPTQPLTRGQMATFLVRALRLPRAPNGPAFTDTAGSSHADAIRDLAAAGITSGCAPDRFCPGAPVTRAMTASLLARALQLTGDGELGFTDVAPGSTHAANIDAVADAGITLGCDPDRFCPDVTLTREQMASLLARAFLGL